MSLKSPTRLDSKCNKNDFHCNNGRVVGICCSRSGAESPWPLSCGSGSLGGSKIVVEICAMDLLEVEKKELAN